MNRLIRMSLSIERSLVDKLERLVRKSGYSSRSEFVRDLIRDRLVEREWDRDATVLGSITLIFNHHQHHLSERLTGLQHDHHHEILCTTHVHLDHDLCAESLLVRGKASRIKKIADALRGQKGVLHASLSLSSIGKKLA
jgi:CopG family nickel-responsive transcriptional regulator